mmetsp:Transcript_8289/g.13093  ORF Transcript_8289/g.13093 Transcript_8289/m.13093 type:complete len:209 (-) Transcript_8289:94-720(-)
MHDGHGGIAMAKQHCHGQAYQITPSDDHRVGTLHLHADAIDQLDASLGSTRYVKWNGSEVLPIQFGISRVCRRVEQTCGIVGVQSIHVFFGTHRLENFGLVDLRRQWELNQYAVHFRIVIPFANLRQQHFLRDGIDVLVFLEEGLHAAIGTGPLFHPDVSLRILAYSYEHDGEAGAGIVGCEGGQFFGEFGADCGGDRFAVNIFSCGG